MTRVGFEPTPFRTRSLVWRLRPLGHLALGRTYQENDKSRRISSGGFRRSDCQVTRLDLNVVPRTIAVKGVLVREAIKRKNDCTLRP
ncbi:hypothetical protein FKP32DRAFT_928834 [Trametes sanguinea]|nr:hypothetical protein FKP32DRAFT_928834 [Trametes sanguinea]